jgi:hypothetical protein
VQISDLEEKIYSEPEKNVYSEVVKNPKGTFLTLTIKQIDIKP